MANPFVGTWDTNFAGVGGGASGRCTLTITESFRFEKSENIVDGMNEGYPGGQPSTVHGTFNPEDSTLSGRWANTPPAEQGDFLLTLGPDNTFTGWFSLDSDTTHTQLAWSGSLKRQHRDIEGSPSPIPIPPPPPPS